MVQCIVHCSRSATSGVLAIRTVEILFDSGSEQKVLIDHASDFSGEGQKRKSSRLSR